MTPTSLQPLDVFRRNIWVCFISDHVGMRDRDLIGTDKIMWEGDYPHTDSTWPNSQASVAEQLKGCTDDEVEQIDPRQRGAGVPLRVST